MEGMEETADSRSKSRSNLVIGSLSVAAIILTLGFVFAVSYVQSPDNDYGVNGGTITEKRYTPAHRETVRVCFPVLLCSDRTRPIGDRWSVHVEKDSAEKWVHITPYEYERYEVGDTYLPQR